MRTTSTKYLLPVIKLAGTKYNIINVFGLSWSVPCDKLSVLNIIIHVLAFTHFTFGFSWYTDKGQKTRFL